MISKGKFTPKLTVVHVPENLTLPGDPSAGKLQLSYSYKLNDKVPIGFSYRET